MTQGMMGQAPIVPHSHHNQAVLPIAHQSAPTCILGNTPVCSTDNISFPNICVLLLTGKQKKSDGWCPVEQVIQIKEVSYKIPNNGFLAANQAADPHSPCACNSVYNPVCGNNGVTYASRCRMECANVKMSHEGPCNYSNWKESPHYNCPCSYEFNPVCGKDGSTYENECAIKCGHQAINHEGACLNPCNCTNVYKPVCSKSRETFKNSCIMKCKGQELWKNENCPDSKPAHCSHCEGLKSPMCGSNGITYDNNCYLKCAGASLYKSGVCPGDESYEGGPQISCSSCKNVFLPVCGADDNSYDNACKARCNGVAIKYKGKCLGGSSGSNMNGCSSNVDPVCGRDGRTYANECEAKAKKIATMHRGACAPRKPNHCGHLCGNSPGAPVCGRDWRTYANDCVANCARVPVLSSGACEPLNTSNYPTTFNYPQIAIQPPAVSQPVVQAPAPVQASVSVSHTQKHSHNVSASLANNLDLNNKDSVINVYKMLFPGGHAVNPQVISYKAVLENILLSKWGINASSL